MTIFGIDVSHHQGGALDFQAFRKEGIEFAFIKATEGGAWSDDQFARNLARAQWAGMLVAAYHYVRSDATAAAQVANVRRVVPQGIPVIPDVEANSGKIELSRAVVSGLRAHYSVPLLYLPRWYWQQIGSPSLAGLPALWSSRYPDTMVGNLPSEWGQVPASYWNGYGGLNVAVLQFTSSALIAGRSPLDANAYRGTRTQLAALLGGKELQDMALTDEQAEDLAWRTWATCNGVRTFPSQQGIPQRLWGKPAAPAIADVLDRLTTQNDDEANIIQAVRDIVAADSNADLTVTPEQAEQLAQSILSRLSSSVRNALAEAFARAGESAGDTLTMPDLVGKTPQEARDTLAGLGWTGDLDEQDGETADPAEIGKIIAQALAAGTSISADEDIAVTVGTQAARR